MQHTGCTDWGFLYSIVSFKTIYSPFYDSGIIELLVEARVGSKGSIRSAMKGSDKSTKSCLRPFSEKKKQEKKNKNHDGDC